MADTEKNMEEHIYELIKPILVDCLQKDNIPVSNISFRLGQGKNGNYSSVLIVSTLIMRIHFRGKKNYLAVPKKYYNKFEALLPPDIVHDFLLSDTEYVRIFIDEPETVLSLSDFITSCTVQALDDLPTQFDCCSRYEECSDSMQCINPDQELALGCSYRKKLRAGIAYYGKNAFKNLNSSKIE